MIAKTQMTQPAKNVNMYVRSIYRYSSWVSGGGGGGASSTAGNRSKNRQYKKEEKAQTLCRRRNGNGSVVACVAERTHCILRGGLLWVHNKHKECMKSKNLTLFAELTATGPVGVGSESGENSSSAIGTHKPRAARYHRQIQGG